MLKKSPHLFNRRILTRPGMALLVAAILIGCASQSKNPPAPDFTLTDLQGRKFSLKDFRGKVVFLDFWATWCPPCVVSVPEVESLSTDYKGKKVEVISISMDDSAEAVRYFMQTHPISSRLALSNREIEFAYRIRGIPAFYIIDQEGLLVKAWGGYHPSLRKIWRAEIDKLLRN